MRLLMAILLGKLVAYLTKLFKIGGGSAAPGLIALKIYPELVEKLSCYIPKNVVITGTNGKTTTARLLSHFAKNSKLKVIRNHTGSNLERGIASTLISCVNLKGCRLNFDLGVWELDEAAFNTVTLKLKPNIIVFLNIFRDQLDRYGEIDTVTSNWCQTLKKTPSETLVLVNGDDVNTSKLSKCLKRGVQKFGVKDYKIVGESLEYSKERENLDFEAKNVKTNGLIGSSFVLTMNDERLTINLPIPGVYHIYDALAAFACAYHLNLPIRRLADTLKTFSPAFGRVEKFTLQAERLQAKQEGYIFLIKNPAGATQVFETIAPNIKPNDCLLLALNDNLADGRDVSWIWDARFENLISPSLRAPKGRGNLIIVSGIRTYDLAVRLKYAGIDPKKITVEPDLEKAFTEARKGLKGRLLILPTYTAMLELQSILTKLGIKKHYWEEES